MVPPSATLFPPSQEATSKNDLLGQPSWDGVGPRPTEFTKGLDEDFGQIHAFWSNSYVDRVSFFERERRSMIETDAFPLLSGTTLS